MRGTPGTDTLAAAHAARTRTVYPDAPRWRDSDTHRTAGGRFTPAAPSLTAVRLDRDSPEERSPGAFGYSRSNVQIEDFPQSVWRSPLRQPIIDATRCLVKCSAIIPVDGRAAIAVCRDGDGRRVSRACALDTARRSRRANGLSMVSSRCVRSMGLPR